MKFVHRIVLDVDKSLQQFLKNIGINVDLGCDAFLISEDDDKWPEIKSKIVEWDASDWLNTEFSADEIKQATSFEIDANWHRGYPQPDDDFGFLEESYDLSEYCDKCGSGMKQIRPIFIKGKINWSATRKIFQLNWLFDTYFVEKSAYISRFKKYGIDCWPVKDWKSKKEIENVVQLKIEKTDKDLVINDLDFEICCKCKRKKYVPFTRGFFPHFSVPEERQLVKTKEIFGSGHSSWSAVIVQRDLFDDLNKRKERGIGFTPVN